MTQTYKVQVSMNQAHIVESGFVWKQGDFGFNIEIEVLDFDTTGATPQIIFRKSTGAVEATQISVAGNKFTYAIRGTELDTPGPCVCDLKLNDSTTKRVSTASFKYFVIPDTMDGLEQEASSYSDTIAQIVGGFDDSIIDLNNKVSVIKSDFYGIDTATDLIPEFEMGGFVSDTGNPYSFTNRIRTKESISNKIVEIEMASGYNAKLYAWEGTTYKGAWTGTVFSTNYLAFIALKVIPLYSFRKNYPSYNFKIVIDREDSADMTPSEGNSQKYYSVKIDESLTKNLYAADAKITGERFTNIENKIISKEKLGGQWEEFIYPSDFSGNFKPVKLYTDGRYWKTDYNKEDWKVTNSAPKTYYVGINGTYLNDGLSREKPITIYNAFSRASAGDTVIIMEGDYRNDTVTNSAIPSITKSLNIIGEGKVRISKSMALTPSYDSETGLYKITQNAMQGVYDPTTDIYFKLAESIDDCQNTPNSIYMGSQPTIYINMNDSHEIIAVLNDLMFVVDATSNDVQVYMENIELMGGGGCLSTNTSSSYDCLIVCDNCRFTYNIGNSNNTVKIESAKAIFNKCIARYARNDGFAYTIKQNGAASGFVEIDCESYNNGFYISSDSSNGSTSHSGFCGIRVNGIYHDNKGCNVADVQSGTQTINCGCSAFDSVASQQGYNEGFGCQQAGATQWLYNCAAFGNFYDLYGVPDTNQITYRSAHNTSNYNYDYSGTLTENDPKTLQGLTFENMSKIVRQLSNFVISVLTAVLLF